MTPHQYYSSRELSFKFEEGQRVNYNNSVVEICSRYAIETMEGVYLMYHLKYDDGSETDSWENNLISN